MKIKLQDDCHEIEIKGNAVRVVTPRGECVWMPYTTEEVDTVIIEVKSRDTFIVQFNDKEYLGVIVGDSIVYTMPTTQDSDSTDQKKAKYLVRFLQDVTLFVAVHTSASQQDIDRPYWIC